MKHYLSSGKSFFLSFFVVIAILFSSCKKDKNEDKTPSSSNNNTANTSSYYGIIQAIETGYVYFYNDSLYGFGGPNSNAAQAQFSSQPLVNNGYVFGTDIDAGNVSLNGTVLKKYTTNPIYYSDTTYSTAFPPQHWVISGSAQVPAFGFDNNDSVPVYTGYNLIPDTIYKSQGFSLPITGVSGCDEIQLFISSSGGTILKIYDASGLTQINLAASEFSSITTGTIIFQLKFSKNNLVNVSGKNYKFQTSKLLQVGNIDLEP